MKHLLLILIFILATGTFVFSAPEQLLQNLNKGALPIAITSDRLEADDLARKVKFVGSVVVRRGDVTLYAGEVLVTYLQGRGDVEKIVASGGVRIIQNDRIAMAERATLFQLEGRILLNGSARLLQGKDTVEGEEITVLLNEEKSIIKAQPGGRVNAIFHPSQEEVKP